MEIMVSLSGSDDDRAHLEKLISLGAGVELSSYGMVGIQSESMWEERLDQHLKMVESLKGQGRVVIHGPFIGIEYNHMDHLIREAIQKRMDKTFEAARSLSASRVVLHNGFKMEYVTFRLEEHWLTQSIAYWNNEIIRWEEKGIEVVIENIVDRSPFLLNQLIDTVDNPYLNLCLDIGHVHVFSDLSPSVWVKQMGSRLKHVHLHDNDGTLDHHWPIGKGTIEFEPFYEALEKYAPDATLSLEQLGDIEDRLKVLHQWKKRFCL